MLFLTLNRPAASNAISIALLEEIAAAIDIAEQDDSIRVLALTGAGSTFCAGGDIGVLARGESIFGRMDDVDERLRRQVDLQRSTVVRLGELRKPTVAFINGPAVGAGLALALACDLRYVTASARLRPSFTAVGLAGDFGCTWLMTELVGAVRARELLLLGRDVTAEEAERIGLVTRTIADDIFPAEVRSVAAWLAARSGPALAAVKDNVRHARFSSLAESADHEAAWHVRLLDTDEHRVAVQAALEAIRADRSNRQPGL